METMNTQTPQTEISKESVEEHNEQGNDIPVNNTVVNDMPAGNPLASDNPAGNAPDAVKAEEAAVALANDQAAATPMIKNPLPLPTPHTHREEVDYDYEVPEDQMHYDIEKPSRNYYDIQ